MGTNIGLDTIIYCEKCRFYHYTVLEQGSHVCRHPENIKERSYGKILTQTKRKPECCKGRLLKPK